MFREYAEHGWVLVPLKPDEKRPRKRDWNLRENCIAVPLVADKLRSAGLAHAYSGTCALDIDNLKVAREGLAEIGVDIDKLVADPAAVRIDSGRENRVKLLFQLEEPLPSRVIVKDDMDRHAAQLRCATQDGLTLQDVLPPSPHPETGGQYEWAYGDPAQASWQNLPPLPQTLLEWWQEHAVPVEHTPGAPATAAPEELRELVHSFDPDCNYTEWIRIGMAIHHESEGAEWGFQLWDEWSARASHKYKGTNDLYAHWRSFGDAVTPVTVGTLRSERSVSADEFPELPSQDKPEPEDDPWKIEKDANRPTFQLVHAQDWANKPAPEWIIRGLLPQQDLAMLYGAPSSGKSFWAMDVALSIAGEDENWRDEYETKNGDVVWLAAEAAGSLRNRLQAYAQGYGMNIAERNLWIIGETPDLSQREHVKEIVTAVKSKEPRLIVVDTLSAASGGANENSGEDMNAILDACRAMHNATGALVLVVHHSGKDVAKGARGWSGIVAAMHTEIEVKQLPDSPARVATITKQRDGETGVQLPFQLLPVQISMEDSSCVVDHFANAQLAAMTTYTEPFEISVSEPHYLKHMLEYWPNSEGEPDDVGSDEFGDLIE